MLGIHLGEAVLEGGVAELIDSTCLPEQLSAGGFF